MGINVTVAELTKILDVTPHWQNIMLVGRHGVGKSRVISDYFAEAGRRVVVLFLGQMSDPGDIIGLPALDGKTGKTEFRLPWWFPEDGEPVVLFLDELNRARPEILQCVMDLTLNKTIVGRALPAGSQIISAVNEGEEYQLTDLDPALISRFNIYHFNPSVEEWLVWAQKKKLDSRVVNFIAEYPNYLDSKTEEDTGLNKTPDRRSWERVSEIATNTDNIDRTYEKIIAGIVGTAAALQFSKFCGTRGALNPKTLLSGFEKYKKNLANAQPHELSVLNEACFRIIEAEGDEGRRKDYAVNFGKYALWLYAGKLNEALANWATLFDSSTYLNAKIAVMTYSPEVLTNLEKFIKAIAL
jgi:hypothetical protein